MRNQLLNFGLQAPASAAGVATAMLRNNRKTFGWYFAGALVDASAAVAAAARVCLFFSPFGFRLSLLLVCYVAAAAPDGWNPHGTSPRVGF